MYQVTSDNFLEEMWYYQGSSTFMITIAPSKISYMYMAYAQNTVKDTSLDTNDCSVTHAVVLKLLEGLENCGHHVYMDNYYTSPSLFQNL